jgi:hypothetical protein
MNRIIGTAAMGAGFAFAGLAGGAQPAAGEVVPGVWQHHKVTISYFGITSAYSCDALETHVRNILLHLGARKDAKVDANCPRGPEEPSHDAWIASDFYTLAPAESASAPGIVNAHWVAREVTPQQPHFMSDGDCELIDQMKGLISQSFSWRDVTYRTDCVPHEINLNGFAIEGQALMPVDQQGAVPGAVTPGATATSQPAPLS